MNVWDDDEPSASVIVTVIVYVVFDGLLTVTVPLESTETSGALVVPRQPDGFVADTPNVQPPSGQLYVKPKEFDQVRVLRLPGLVMLGAATTGQLNGAVALAPFASVIVSCVE